MTDAGLWFSTICEVDIVLAAQIRCESKLRLFDTISKHECDITTSNDYRLDPEQRINSMSIIEVLSHIIFNCFSLVVPDLWFSYFFRIAHLFMHCDNDSRKQTAGNTHMSTLLICCTEYEKKQFLSERHMYLITLL